MDCKQITYKLVFQYTDGEMEHELRIDFRRHMDDCPKCARQAEQARRFLMVVQRCRRCAVPQGLAERIRDRLRSQGAALP